METTTIERLEHLEDELEAAKRRDWTLRRKVVKALRRTRSNRQEVEELALRTPPEPRSLEGSGWLEVRTTHVLTVKELVRAEHVTALRVAALHDEPELHQLKGEVNDPDGAYTVTLLEGSRAECLEELERLTTWVL